MRVARVGFGLWVLVAVVLCFVYFSNNALSKIPSSSSRVELHVVYYFLGAVLCFYSFRQKGIRLVVSAGMGVFLLGVVLEFAQVWVPYRTFNYMDILANGMGVVIFMLVWGVGMKNSEW